MSESSDFPKMIVLESEKHKTMELNATNIAALQQHHPHHRPHGDTDLLESNSPIGTDQDEKMGWLEKQGEDKVWKKRYFVLKENRLKYYKKENLKTLQGEIHLEGSVVVEEVSEKKYKMKHCFEVHCTKKNRIHAMAADSAEEMKEWMTQIKFASLRLRKQKAQANRDRQISVLLQEQEEAAKRRLTGGSESDMDQQHRNSDPQQSEKEKLRKHTVSFNLPQEKPHNDKAEPEDEDEEADDNANKPQGAPGPQDNQKYQQYLDWLKDTQSHQRRGTILPKDNTMDEELLTGNQKEPQPCWKGCVTM